MENKKHYLFKRNIIKEVDGTLVVIESLKDIPFDIKRIFYEYGVSYDSLRGNHANRHSKFCMIAVCGSCTVDVDDGENKNTYLLENPEDVLFLDNMVWKTMYNFSKNCVLVVLSSEYYDQNEYIRNYDEFIKERRK